MTRAPQLSGRRHIFVTPVAAVSLLRFSTCAFVCPCISCFVFGSWLLCNTFSCLACRGTLPSDPSFCSSTWSNFLTNLIVTAMSLRDISAQKTALLLSALLIALATRTKSLNLPSLPFAGQTNRHGPGVRVSFAKH